MGDIRADPLLSEAILHDARGLPCPAVFGGLPLSPSPNDPPDQQPLPQPAPHLYYTYPPPTPPPLSLPSLVELPSLRTARQEAARRCREALLGADAGGWWPVLERAGVGRMETLPLGAFDVAMGARSEEGGGEEDAAQEQERLSSSSPPRAALVGLLVRKRGGGARLVDATGSMPLHFTLPGVEAGEQRLVHWREGSGAPLGGQPPFARPAVVGEEGEGNEEEEEAAVDIDARAREMAMARIGALPWAEAPATGAALPAEQAGRMVALRGGGGQVQLFADVLSWRRQQQERPQQGLGVGVGGGGKAEQEAEANGGEDSVEVALAVEDGAIVTVQIRPFLLVTCAAVLPLQPPPSQTADPPTPSALAAPSQPLPPAPPIDWRACRLAPAQRIESRRARSNGKYWDAPPQRLLVLVRRVEQQGYHGAGSSSSSGSGGSSSSGRVVLLCKDANDPAPAVARLFLYASHHAGTFVPTCRLSSRAGCQ